METNRRKYIEKNPKIMFGKPVIIETRIPVDLILEKLSLGEITEKLLKSYSSLNKESIYACLAFASESVRNEVVSG